MASVRPSRETRLVRNDWSGVHPPQLGQWTPHLSVSVIVAIQGGGSLTAALAALAGQTYPAHLIDVVVVIADDRCLTPSLPALRPANCRLVRSTGGGLSAARAYGARQSTGEILCWLDGDLIAGPRHLEAHARWLHSHPALATIGRVWTSGADPAHPTQERMIRRTRGLRSVDHLGFEAFTVPGAAVPRALYHQVGGLDPQIPVGQGLELGYRLWQAGTVLVPEPRAIACATAPRDRTPPNHSAAALALRLPQPRWLRDQLPNAAPPGALPANAAPTSTAPVGDQPATAANTVRRPSARRRATPGGSVPLIRAVVPVADVPFERVRDCLEHILAGDERDLEITAVHRADASDWDLRLIQAHFLHERRVRFSAVAPTTAFPSPYLLEIPVDWAVAPHTVTKLVAHADRARVGLVELTVPGHGTVVRLWRTRALCRGLRVRAATESRADAVATVHGRRRLRAAPGDLTPMAGPGGTPEPPLVPPPAAESHAAAARRTPHPRWWRRGPLAWLGQARSAMRRRRARSPSS